MCRLFVVQLQVFECEWGGEGEILDSLNELCHNLCLKSQQWKAVTTSESNYHILIHLTIYF